MSGTKNRPAVTLIVSDDDVVLSFLTTQLKWKTISDILIVPSKENGLKKDSLVRLDKITTIHKDLVIGKIGMLSIEERKEIKSRFVELLSELA